jgi:iron complex outermembrane receptor protein
MMSLRSTSALAALLVALTPAGARAEAPLDTLPQVVPLPGIEVSTTRPGERAPVARSVLARDAVRRANWGQDTPMALAALPGAYAYSDAGNGIGYSYLSIRGFPQRRISVHVNGVPLNDPQSHEVYWIDHPDLLASASEVEVQRGVGSALYGAASLGGSVNLETSPFTETPRASAAVSYGSWETKRLMLEMNSGRLQGDWNLYGRYSRIETEGYRDQSWSKLWSYSLGARRGFERHSLRVNLYGGPEETHLAYLGVPAPYLDGAVTGDADRDRRFNPITYDNERDHFFEPHYEIHHTWAPARGVTFSQTVFWFDGKGYYDERRTGRSLADFRLAPWATADSTLAPRDYYAQDGSGNLVQDAQGRFTLERFDLVRRRTVENRHTGWVPRVRFERPEGSLTLGGELRHADGRHWGELVSGAPLPPGAGPGHKYYDYHPRTLSGGLFARAEWRALESALVTADLGWRHQSYLMRGDRFDGIRFDQGYDFATPRLGVTWSPRSDLQLFGAWAHASREPAFRDLYDAEGPGSLPLYRVVDVANGLYDDPLIRPERVHDLEAGAAWRGPWASATVNLFRMDFRDELVYAGQFNTDLGYPILGNAARSVHQGIELAARAERRLIAGARLALDANASFSDHHFVEYREVYGTAAGDTVRYDGNAIGFFPATLANLSARLAWNRATLGAEAGYAGRLYLDNNQDLLSSAGPRTVVNLTGALRLPAGPESEAELSLRLLNAFDTRYAAGGYMDYDAAGALVPHFVPAATRHWIAQVRMDF